MEVFAPSQHVALLLRDKRFHFELSCAVLVLCAPIVIEFVHPSWSSLKKCVQYLLFTSLLFVFKNLQLREMATNPSEGGGNLSEAFLHVAQGLVRVQRAMRLQEQDVQRRLQEAVRVQIEKAMRVQEQEAQRRIQESVRLQVDEALRLHEKEAQRRLQEAVDVQQEKTQRKLQNDQRRLQIAHRTFHETVRLQEERAATAVRQMEQQLRERDDVITALRHSLDERVQRLEARVAAVEQQVKAASARRGSEETGEQEALGQLESRMGKLEEAVQRAQASVFPPVEALVEWLETSPPGALLSPSPSSASTSSAPQPPAVSVALGASVTAAAGDVDRLRHLHHRRYLRLKRRVRRVDRRMLRSRSVPWRLGEALCKTINPDEVRCLFDSGADANYTNTDGKRPLISALLARFYFNYGNPEVVSLLLARGADANSIDTAGYSTLQTAVVRCYEVEMVDLLNAAGSDEDARERDWASPLQCATHEEEGSMVLTLVAAGANKSRRGWSGMYEFVRAFGKATYESLRDVLRP